MNRWFFAFSGGAWNSMHKVCKWLSRSSVWDSHIHNFLVSFAAFLWSSHSELNTKRLQWELRNYSVVGFCNHVWPTPMFQMCSLFGLYKLHNPTQAITPVSRCYISTCCIFHFRHLKNLERFIMGTKIT